MRRSHCRLSTWRVPIERLCFFFFNDTATTEIYTLSLHDALPIFLGPELGDMGPIELLKRLVESEAIAEMPFVIYGTEGLGGPEQEQLRRLAEVLLLKRGPTRKAMLDEITLFLKHTLGTHRAAGHERAAPPAIQQGLANRKGLNVHDDVRNVFALTRALEQCGMTVLNAESG